MNLVFSWLSAVLALLLIALFPVRKLVQKSNHKPCGTLTTAHKLMRKTHVAIGIILIPVVYCHCRIAFHVTGVRSILGAALLVLLILLTLTWLLRKTLHNCWRRLHQVLAAMLTVVMACHCFIEF